MNKTMSRKALMSKLEVMYPKAWFKTSEAFNGHKGGIWTGEGSEVTVEACGDTFELELFNYWAEDFNECTYVMGVYKPLHEFLESVGWFAEFHDAGTVMIWN